MSKYGNSSFWLGDIDDDIITKTMSKQELKSHDLYKMASIKRSISNFVNIVTGENIPVQFRGSGESYTNGESVVIGANVTKPKDFDVCVGLALHEGSHIKLSDFDLLRRLDSLLPDRLIQKAEKYGIGYSETKNTVKNIWNYVEDRRIDNFIYKNSPGYREYYLAMYDKYFNDRIIDKALRTNEYTDETLESYMFRIINLTNKNTRLDALNGLRGIYNTINLQKIGRLKTSHDALMVTLKVFEIILDNLSVPKSTSSSDSDESKNSDSENSQNSSSQMTGESSGESSDSSGSNESEMDNSDDGDETDGGSDSSSDNENSDNSDNEDDDSETEELTDRQRKLLPKKIKKQKKFLDGEVQKTTVSESQKKELDMIEESGSELKTVGSDVQDTTSWYGHKLQKGIDCIVVKKMTKSLLDSRTCPLSSGTSYVSVGDEVTEGIRIGTLLGKKLQVRGEERNTIYNRQKTGKIDRRMVASLGFGNENVFQYLETDSFKKANLHISIDASGSMNGSKWRETIINVTALAKAVDMISNLEIQVSFRSTYQNKPYILMAYDSRTDKFMKVKQLFPYLSTGGTTPEGLCFEAIMDEFLPVSNDLDSYFVNISDGLPYFYSRSYYYTGHEALKHTRSMVKKIQSLGIKVLSYYVDDSYRSTNTLEPSPDFVEMYGRSARKIDVTNVNQISRTMNKLFLEK